MDETNALVKALGYAENGGKPNLGNPSQGKTGEMKSVFQFTPDTWKNYSKQVLGKTVPLSPDAETYVVQKKVHNWLSHGYKPEQIFSMWNAGQGEPDAYTGQFSDGSASKGVNKKYGKEFNVPEYVNKGMGYYNQFANENKSNLLRDKVLAMMRGGQNQQPTQSGQTNQTVQPGQGLMSQLTNV